MPVYKYSGRTTAGAMKKGTITAPSEKTAIQKLRQSGINPRQIEESTSLLHKELNLSRKVKHEDFIVFCRQFSTLIRAGVALVESLHILAVQTNSKVLSTTLMAIEEDVRAGTSFSSAAAKRDKVFPPLFTNMMRVGEATGNIDATLERLAVHYEKQHKLRKSIQSTLMYPAVLLVVILVVAIGLMVTIVPSFAEMYEDFGADLPFITTFILGISEVMQTLWWVILLVMIAAIIGFQLLFKSNPQFKYSVYYFTLKMPVFGSLLQKSAIAQMTRTLASLFSSSVPILQALSIVENVVQNPIIRDVLKEAKVDLERGKSLAGPFEKSWVFPPLVTHMMTIGEQTGSLDYMLEKVADFYEEDVDRTVETLKSLIEPMMIVLLAGVVGTIVLAILVPMFSLFEQIG